MLPVEARSSDGLLRLPRTMRVTAAIAEEVLLPRKESLLIEVEGAICATFALPSRRRPIWSRVFAVTIWLMFLSSFVYVCLILPSTTGHVK